MRFRRLGRIVERESRGTRSVSFHLTYRKGSFPRREMFASRSGAMERACVLLKEPGCFQFQISDEHGVLLVDEPMIRMACAAKQ